MEDSLNTQNPHLRVQRALANARTAGATEATLTIHPGNRTATLDDNRNPGVLHSETFDMELPGRAASQWDPHYRLRRHDVPAGLHATLEVWPESHWPGFALREADVFKTYMAWWCM